MSAMLDDTRFAHDPIAGDSAQFPLAKPLGTPLTEAGAPSPLGVRPWNLRQMVETAPRPDKALPEWTYDHECQVAVDGTGAPLVINDASADSVSDNDGDEGRSEDWKYDYVQDDPGTAV